VGRPGAAAQGLPDQLAAALLSAARQAFTSGLHVVAAVSAVLLAAVAMLVVTRLRHVRPLGAAAEAEGAATAEPVARQAAAGCRALGGHCWG
jgi:DHA2 family multidrug resistance protein-like MFS transporter